MGVSGMSLGHLRRVQRVVVSRWVRAGEGTRIAGRVSRACSGDEAVVCARVPA